MQMLSRIAFLLGRRQVAEIGELSLRPRLSHTPSYTTYTILLGLAHWTALAGLLWTTTCPHQRLATPPRILPVHRARVVNSSVAEGRRLSIMSTPIPSTGFDRIGLSIYLLLCNWVISTSMSEAREDGLGLPCGSRSSPNSVPRHAYFGTYLTTLKVSEAEH
ncbi:hypothetical protein GGS23DRAFT_586194 [Durotheca rogersii]|uniref:uncharacterized protein n=1 Tax=Durotheca rogersii TaxID=419775 RepID=UPI00221F4FD9|nr:uncharacterized protein GGS23DRAFT_586194 [Durotheca rogersii]KAI5859384.1 hypothetical protein GGS23DRAFT_586194 [Durotheca rogersii]